MANEFPSSDAIRTQMAALKEPDPVKRQEAIHYLARSVIHDDVVIPAVANALDDADLDVCREAAVALFMFGARASVVASALTRALMHTDLIVRRAAAATIGTIGPSAAGAAANLHQLENDPDDLLRVWVLEALRAIGEEPNAPSKRSRLAAG